MNTRSISNGQYLIINWTSRRAPSRDLLCQLPVLPEPRHQIRAFLEGTIHVAPLLSGDCLTETLWFQNPAQVLKHIATIHAPARDKEMRGEHA